MKRIGMSFCTVVNCMDGRIQIPVIKYLQKRFNVKYVDSVTEAGPNLILAKRDKKALVNSILSRVQISVEKHGSVGIAVVGHYGCAGNPAPKEEQIVHIQQGVEFVRREYPGLEVIGLWVDENWKVHDIASINFVDRRGNKLSATNCF